MKKEVFEEILHAIHLPMGEMLEDGSTYRITCCDFDKIGTKYKTELADFEKFLILSDSAYSVVGGILFYGASDIQVIVFPEYRGKHYMSKVHKNGILKSECYLNQKVSLDERGIESFNDFGMKHYLLKCAGLHISNLEVIHRYFNSFESCEKYEGFQNCEEKEFIERFL